jgi:hypothetical protein
MEILGMILRPCSMTEEDNEAVMKTSKYYTESDFHKKYSENIAANQIIAESAKIFILKNYKSIKDWSLLDVTIRDNTGKETRYYKFIENKWKGKHKRADFLDKFFDKMKDNQNPIESLTEAVLDPTDGDFSITINGKDHLWIDDGSVITIANYIEKKLNSEAEPERSVATKMPKEQNPDNINEPNDGNKIK